MNNLERAVMVAEKAHSGQTYDIYPYMYHVKQVVKISQELGYDETIQVGAALHDVMEDTELSYNDIKKAFGIEVAEIVYAVTDELGRNRYERKLNTLPKIRANWKATVVKICDRIANMEQSKKYDDRKYRMYQEENNNFCNQLMSEDHPLNETKKAWDRLHSLVNEK